MNKTLRFGLVLIVLIGAVLIFKDGIAGALPGPKAASPAPVAFKSAPEDIAETEALDIAPSGVFQGTASAPGCEGITVVQPNDYSVCGLAILKATSVAENVRIAARLAEEAEIPGGAGKVLIGTLRIEWFVENKLENGPNDQFATVDICFSNYPDKTLVVKYYDDELKTWNELETVVQNNEACAKMTMTGFYVLAEKE
jgi:hypothetical protein